MKLGIDILRHLLAIFVIAQHMASSRYSAETNSILRNFVDYIDGDVAGFFLIAGSFSKRPSDLVRFIPKQIQRLIVPFLAFSILYAFTLSLLGKGSLENGLRETLLLRGSGMQLYFLPYLFYVSTAISLLEYFLGERTWKWANPLFAFAMIATCLAYPTSNSNGHDPHLLAFYALAYSVGGIYRTTRSKSVLAIAAAAFYALGFQDHRFFDMGFMTMLFVAADAASVHLKMIRFPGSGGVYLMHTPVVNFMVSVALEKIGITEIQNIVASVILTYAICLGASLAICTKLPKYRWLILE
jgi:fucose 4-O-acetylase-like acetyltransferase